MRYYFFALFLCSTVSYLAQTKTTYTYSIKGQDTLKLDIYTPDKIKVDEKLPTLLWMHGGGFAAGSRDDNDDAQLCKYFAQNRFIGISISYRLLRKGTKTGFGCDCKTVDKLETFKQATIDYLDAAVFVVSNANEFHVDIAKIIAGGSSAGAEGTLNAVFMKEHFVDDLDKYKDVTFAGIFSCAGAIVNAEYITEKNTIPGVFYHGTNDRLVPFASAPHHHCDPEQPGYMILDGSEVIVKKLEEFDTSYYFKIVKGGGHEVSAIPFADLDSILNFFNMTINNGDVIKTKIIKTNKL